MGIWEEEKILIFIAFVIPGFVAIKTYEILYPSEQADFSKKLIDAVSYSCVNYALLIWPILIVESTNLASTHRNLYAIFYICVLFVAPVAWVVIWKLLRESDLVQDLVPHPTKRPWDYVFGQRRTYWIIVTKKNGEKIAGMYGVNSFASSAPAEEQLYLEEEWVLNEEGGFDRAVTQSAGIIVLASEIATVEFFYSGDDSNG